jgi:ATP-binding cassette subfamily F protein uup
LSFKEKRELEELPARIEMLEGESGVLHVAMADPAFYKRPSSEIAETKATLEQLERDLEEAFARWETLEGREA